MPGVRVPRNVALTLASNLLISAIARWLEDGKQYSPGQMAGWVLDLSIHGYVRVLGLQRLPADASRQSGWLDGRLGPRSISAISNAHENETSRFSAGRSLITHSVWMSLA